jgi:hypothetical protein
VFLRLILIGPPCFILYESMFDFAEIPVKNRLIWLLIVALLNRYGQYGVMTIGGGVRWQFNMPNDIIR